MINLIKFLGSVRFTVIISVGLILLLILSTSMEALHGTPFAQKTFYNTRWFDFLVSLLWVNIFCSTVIRFPFRKHQTGFLVTHIGILVLLAGALITRTHSMEGYLSVYEGETVSSVKQSGFSLAAIFPDQEQSTFALKTGSYNLDTTKERMAAKGGSPVEANQSAVPAAKVSFNIVKVIEHAADVRQVTAEKLGAVNHGVKVNIKSKQMGEDNTVWLVEREAGHDTPDQAMAGTVLVNLLPVSKPVQPKKPVFHIKNSAGEDLIALDLESGNISGKIALAQTGWSIQDLEYYPFATVADNKLKNFPEGRKFNPAVVFNLVDDTGKATRQVRFGFFPDFESMHPGGDQAAHSFRYLLDAGEPGYGPQDFDGLQISLFYGDNNAWTYQTRYQDTVLKQGPIAAGACVSTGRMDVMFCTRELVSMARVKYTIEPDKSGQGPFAAAITIPSLSKDEQHWIVENKETPFILPQGEVRFTVREQTVSLPFAITLKQFRKIDYPGTQDPASFESDVIFKDLIKGVTLERTISMNRPLEYDGFKIFQTSYMRDQSGVNGSVFTVAKNPGIPWIYLGSIIALLGALFQFYLVKEDK